MATHQGSSAARAAFSSTAARLASRETSAKSGLLSPTGVTRSDPIAVEPEDPLADRIARLARKFHTLLVELSRSLLMADAWAHNSALQLNEGVKGSKPVPSTAPYQPSATFTTPKESTCSHSTASTSSATMGHSASSFSGPSLGYSPSFALSYTHGNDSGLVYLEQDTHDLICRIQGVGPSPISLIPKSSLVWLLVDSGIVSTDQLTQLVLHNHLAIDFLEKTVSGLLDQYDGDVDALRKALDDPDQPFELNLPEPPPSSPASSASDLDTGESTVSVDTPTSYTGDMESVDDNRPRLFSLGPRPVVYSASSATHVSSETALIESSDPEALQLDASPDLTKATDVDPGERLAESFSDSAFETRNTPRVEQRDTCDEEVEAPVTVTLADEPSDAGEVQRDVVSDSQLPLVSESMVASSSPEAALAKSSSSFQDQPTVRKKPSTSDNSKYAFKFHLPIPMDDQTCTAFLRGLELATRFFPHHPDDGPSWRDIVDVLPIPDPVKGFGDVEPEDEVLEDALCSVVFADAIVLCDPDVRPAITAHRLARTRPAVDISRVRIANKTGRLVSLREVAKGDIVLREPPLVLAPHLMSALGLFNFHKILQEHAKHRAVQVLDSLTSGNAPTRLTVLRKFGLPAMLPNTCAQVPMIAVFKHISYASHACETANCVYEWNKEKFQGVLRASRKILRDEQLTISFIADEIPTHIRVEEIRRRFGGAMCTCVKCRRVDPIPAAIAYG